jgi:lysophospholipase L1-like esterase
VRIRRVLTSGASAILGIASVLTVVGVSAPAADAASGVNYVALGDSYSAGVGAGDYISSTGSCDQSTNSYPQVWASQNSPASFNDETCSGATTSDVLSSQLGALNDNTTLVSITIGGNDIGFSNVMETCVLDSDSDCQSAVATAENEAQTTLPGELANLYQTISADAPNAQVVVLGYPELYDLSMSDICVGLSTSDRTALNQGADVLDGVIQTAADNAGFTFVDVRGIFSGHEICDYFNEWLNSVTIPVDNSYHPNADGQEDGYLPSFAGAIS